MAYEAFGELFIGIILIAIGARLNMTFAVANMIRLGLILIGIIVLVIGAFGIMAQLPS